MRVTVRMKGGLGNQLFQYAAGLGLSRRLKCPLSLDIQSGFIRDRQYRRQYELLQLGVSCAQAGVVGTTAFQVYSRVRRWTGSTAKHTWGPGHIILRDGVDLATWRPPQGFRRPIRVLLDGYWQEPSFFADIEPFLRTSIRVDGSLPTRGELVKLTRSERSVAIHVRRFSAEGAVAASDLEADYYDRAIRQVMAQLECPEFLIFSDDPVWAHSLVRNVMPRQASVTSVGAGGHLADFALMTRCANNIIANSTYSWWAAWLNANSKKTVIYPLPREGASSKSLPLQLCLPEWIAA